MVKSFLNAFCGGMGRTLGKILVYLAIGLIFFFIYEDAHAAAIYSSLNSCTSTYYNIERVDDNVTYGKTSTSYNFYWNRIIISGTENMTANTYYDITIAMRGTTNISSIFADPIFYQDSSLCGTHTRVLQISGYGAASQTVTVRVLTGSTLVDYWTLSLPFRYNGSNGINTVTLTKLDLTGSDGIIENANDNTNTIVNNNNQNTSDIINNQDSNTTDIINNQSQNTQDIINALDESKYTSCGLGKRYFLIGSDKSYISSQGTGQINSNDNYFVSSPIKVYPNNSYTLNIVNATGIQYGFYCFYTSNMTRISCTKFTDNTTTTYSITSPANAAFFRTTLYRNNDVIKNAYIQGNTCVVNGYESAIISQNNNLVINGIDDILSDNSDGDTNIFSTWWNNFDPLSNPLGSVITLPITLAQKIVGFNSSSCQSVNLGALLGHNLTLTCFTLSSVLPDNASSLINTIDIIMSVSLLVVIIKNTYETIANLISLGGENEVKKQFRLPTPLEFMANLLNGGGN